MTRRWTVFSHEIRTQIFCMSSVYCFLAWHFYDFLVPFFILKGQLLIRYVQILKVKLTWKLRSGSGQIYQFYQRQIAIFCKIFVKLKGAILSQSIRRVILNCNTFEKLIVVVPVRFGSELSDYWEYFDFVMLPIPEMKTKPENWNPN